MISRDDLPDTPDWQPDPVPRDFKLEHLLSTARVREEPPGQEHITLGEN